MSDEVNLRLKILQVAKALFIQHGYHGLSMRQLAEALNVSKAALYYHFQDKEQLFLAILNAYLDETQAMLDQILMSPSSYCDKVAQFVTCVLQQPAEQRAIIRLASQEMGELSLASRQSFATSYHEKFIAKVEMLLSKGMENGEFRPMNATTATWALLGIMYPYFYPAQSHLSTLSSETIEQIIAIFLHGMAQTGE